jgi:3D (Asp-Asp-Asp) domain-containing protein
MGFFFLSGAAMATPAPASVPPEPTPSYSVTLTAYNAVEEQTDSNPFETASGAYSNPEIVAARSQDLAKELPFGTIIEIDGSEAENNSCGYSVVKPIIGYRVIADTMNARYTDRIDVLFDTEANYQMADGKTKNAGMILGICKGVTVRVVGFMNLNKTSRIPKTQSELVALVNGTSKTLAVR